MKGVIHPDFVVPVSYTRTMLPEDSADNQVAATISMMKRYAVEDSRSAGVKQLAADLLSTSASAADYAGNVFDAVQSMMYFQRDELTAQPIDMNAVEVLIRPVDVIALNDAGQTVPGDCDCFSMSCAALLLAGGVPCSFVTISGSANAPDAYSHVYVVAWPDSQYRMVLDASHGKAVGWEAPNHGRYREWAVTGFENGAASSVCILGALLIAAAVLFGGLFAGSTNSIGNLERANA